MNRKIVVVSLILLFFALMFGCTGSDTFIINQTKLNKLFDGNVSGDSGLIPFLNLDGNALEVSSGFDFNKDTNTLSTGCVMLGDGNTYCSSTDFPNPDLSGYFTLDQTTPQTIINGAPKFTKSFIAAKTITNTSLIESMTGGEQAGIFQINPYWDYGIIFSSVGDNPYPLYNSFLKSRSTNGITRKAVKTGDQLGLIEFVGDSGTYYVGGAEIKAEVIATPGTTTMPTDLIFGTNFNTGLIQERWRLTSIGDWVPKADNQKVYFGAGKDASITYDGTNLVVNPKVVGSGILDVQGILQTDGYNSADGTTGLTYNNRIVKDVNIDGTFYCDMNFKNGLLVESDC